MRTRPVFLTASRGRVIAAAVAYLAVSLWALRVTLPAFDRTYSHAVEKGVASEARPGRKALADADQSLMVWATSRNARTLLTHPTRLLDFEQSYPLVRAAGLGHPLYADGIVAIPLWLLGLDPIVVLNLWSVLMLWLSAFAMFLLARHWTGSDAAAFAAGLAFGFHPFRILGAHWPGILGNQWSPLVLLFTHRLFSRGGWREAAALAAFLGLQILGSIYQLIPFAVMGVAYTVAAAVRHRRRLVELAPKLVVVAGVAVASLVVQLSAYLDLRAAWGLGGRGGWPTPVESFLPGHGDNPGCTVLVLAAIGLVDRLRGPRTDPAGEDPRLVYLLMGVLALWTIVRSLPIPWTPWVVPSLLALVADVVPALDTLRGIGGGTPAVYLATALLAAYGVVALMGAGRLGARAVPAVVACCLLAEVFVPPLARWSFAQDVELEVRELDPPSPELRALFRTTLEGPVLDVPSCYTVGFPCRAHSLLLAAYHKHPIAWGWGSYVSPLAAPIERIADQLPSPAAVDALYALGFRTVVLHGERLRAWHPMAKVAASGAPQLVRIGAADQHVVFRLSSVAPVTTDVAALVPAPDPSEQRMTSPGGTVAFRVRNAAASTFSHPMPIVPSDVHVRWVSASGDVVAEQDARGLLPPALAAGAEDSMTLALDAPPVEGPCLVTLALADTPTIPLATARVRVARR